MRACLHTHEIWDRQMVLKEIVLKFKKFLYYFIKIRLSTMVKSEYNGVGPISPLPYLCHPCQTPSNTVQYLCWNKLSSPSLLHLKFDSSIPIYPQPTQKLQRMIETHSHLYVGCSA